MIEPCIEALLFKIFC